MAMVSREVAKKLVAILIVIIVCIAGIVIYLSYKPVKPRAIELATIDDLLRSESARTDITVDLVLTPFSSPYLTLVGTPVALYYDGGTCHAVPLLVAGINSQTQDTGLSRSVMHFITIYGKSRACVLGNIPLLDTLKVEPQVSIADKSLTSISVKSALTFWSKADGVLVIKPEDQPAYNLAVNAVPIACYLNIPVIITDNIEARIVTQAFDKLGVKYTLICGEVKGYYGKQWKLKSVEEIQDIIAVGVPDKAGVLRSLLKDRLNTNCTYITMANPLDISQPERITGFTEVFEGTVVSQDTGSTSNPSSSPDAVTHYITIPEDYTWSNVKLDTKMQFTDSPIPGRTPDLDGQRCYTYFGIDADKDGEMLEDTDSEPDKLQFFVPSLGYATIRDSSGNAIQAHGYMEKPIYKSTGEHAIQIAATLHQTLTEVNPPSTTYTITVTIEKLSAPNYPLMPNISCLAPYLTAYRQGVVLAKPEFSIYSNPELLAAQDCGDPSMTPELIEVANNHTTKVKAELNKLLARLLNMGPLALHDWTKLANKYRELYADEHAIIVGIIADTNMVPWFYYADSPYALAQEGYGVPSDNFYADIDADPTNPPWNIEGGIPSLELATGRVCGWDAQDVSALIARTFFYRDIIDRFDGIMGQHWKASALNTFGSRIPVGTAKTVTEKLDKSFQQAGFTVDSYHDGPLSDSKLTYPIYSASNFIFFCAHGFYYWYVPPGYKPTGVGGGFDVAHIIEHQFGPSVIFGSSCVTGKLDGIQPYNAISLAYLHTGFNCYVGASRLSYGALSIVDPDSNEVYGAYIGLMMYGYLTGYVYDKHGGLISSGLGNLPMGKALMLAKNMYAEKYGAEEDPSNPHHVTIQEFHVIGEPGFNPYEPIHNG
jgi:hypothetical protein